MIMLKKNCAPILSLRIQIRSNRIDTKIKSIFVPDNRAILSSRQCYRAKSQYIAIINNNFNMSNEFLYLPAGHVPDRS